MSSRKIFKNPWWVVVGSTIGLIVGNGPITLFTFGVFLKPIVSTFGWNRGTVASAVTVSQALGALATPFVGRMVDRWGVRRVTLPFITAFALTTAAIALTPASPFIFILLYGICGLFGGGQAPLNYAKAISSWFESKRGLALGIAMSGVGIGTALDPRIVRVLIAHVGWRGAYVGLGVLTFALAFPAVALFIREPDRDSVSDRERLASAGHIHDAAGRFLFAFLWWLLPSTARSRISCRF
jgi:MFS family permease